MGDAISTTFTSYRMSRRFLSLLSLPLFFLTMANLAYGADLQSSDVDSDDNSGGNRIAHDVIEGNEERHTDHWISIAEDITLLFGTPDIRADITTKIVVAILNDPASIDAFITTGDASALDLSVPEAKRLGLIHIYQDLNEDSQFGEQDISLAIFYGRLDESNPETVSSTFGHDGHIIIGPGQTEDASSRLVFCNSMEDKKIQVSSLLICDDIYTYGNMPLTLSGDFIEIMSGAAVFVEEAALLLEVNNVGTVEQNNLSGNIESDITLTSTGITLTTGTAIETIVDLGQSSNVVTIGEGNLSVNTECGENDITLTSTDITLTSGDGSETIVDLREQPSIDLYACNDLAISGKTEEEIKLENPQPALLVGTKAQLNKTVLNDDKDVVVATFQLPPTQSGNDKLYSLTLEASGSGREAQEIEQVKLYQDIDNNGVVDQSDIRLATGYFVFDNETLTLTLDEPLTLGNTVSHYLVTYDF